MAPRAARARRARPGRRGPELPYEERSALFDALQALPPMQRKTVVLRHWLGLSVEETATELGISDGHGEEPHAPAGSSKLQAALAEPLDGQPRQAASPDRSA